LGPPKAALAVLDKLPTPPQSAAERISLISIRPMLLANAWQHPGAPASEVLRSIRVGMSRWRTAVAFARLRGTAARDGRTGRAVGGRTDGRGSARVCPRAAAHFHSCIALCNRVRLTPVNKTGAGRPTCTRSAAAERSDRVHCLPSATAETGPTSSTVIAGIQSAIETLADTRGVQSARGEYWRALMMRASAPCG
jgi:hypothetical protein